MQGILVKTQQFSTISQNLLAKSQEHGNAAMLLISEYFKPDGLKD